jgi:cation:H+ antiporter
MLPIDLILLAAGAYGTYVSIEGLVTWLKAFDGAGFLNAGNLGWLSGWLMVLPNALLALYYGWRRNPEIVYTSQVGDGHICIPLCVGIFAFFQPVALPAMFQTGMLVLFGATIVHFLFVAVLGGLPRFMGALLILAYGIFLYEGLF